jgi:hypothetical protein
MVSLRRRKQTADLEKAAPALPPGSPAGSQAWSAQEAQAFAQGLIAAQQIDTGLPRLEPQVPFGPGIPLHPSAIDPAEPDTGRPAPRQYEYPVTANLPGINDRLIPWRVLRDAADVGMVRRCIEVRKSELTSLDWTIAVSAKAIDAAEREDAGHTPRATIEQQMREKLQPDIDRLRAFWEMPDRHGGYSWMDWYGNFLEEVLVLDALAIYPERTPLSSMYGLNILDGGTIKPLLDHRGMRPLPPNPAYQQLMWGFPRGEFTASTDPAWRSDGNPAGIVDPWRADSLIYKRKLVRSWTPYGFSPVEQALVEIKLWLKRQSWMISEYDDGTIPQLLWELSNVDNMQPSDWRDWMTALNSTLQGSAEQRHRQHLGPPGGKAVQTRDTDERYRPDYDTFIMKLLCAAFDISPTSMGFMETGGLGGQSYHEGQEDVEQRKGIRPWSKWSAGIINQIQDTYLGAPPMLEFKFLGLEEEDEAAATNTLDQEFRGGQRTLNECRDKKGLKRYTFPEADEPVIVASRSIVFINGEMSRQAEAASAKDAITATGGPLAPDTEQNPPADTGQPVKPVAKADELDAFARWAKPGRRRDFDFQHVDQALAATLNELVKTDATGAADLAKAEARDARGRPEGPATGLMAGVQGSRSVEPAVRATFGAGSIGADFYTPGRD